MPAAEIEAAVISQIREMLRAPEVVMSTWRAAQPEREGLAEEEVREALAVFDPLWQELFPAEQASIVITAGYQRRSIGGGIQSPVTIAGRGE